MRIAPRLVPTLVTLAVLGAVGRAQTQLDTFALPGPFGDVGDEVASAGDFDGDGALDALAAGAQAVAVFSGATGAQLAAVPNLAGITPLSIVSLPDVDGDGLRDAVLGDGVSARAISLADGHPLWSQAGSFGGSIGWSMAVLNDIDGDGFPDVAVGEPDADPLGLNSAGSVWVLSGDSGALIHRIDGTAAQQQIGLGVDAGPDLDRDGRLDLFVADVTYKVGGVTVGRVRVQSAADGTLLESIENGKQDFNFGRILANAGDLDGDGDDDVVVSANESGIGLKAYSSVTGKKLWVDAVFPSAIAGVGDVTGDGVPDVVNGVASFFLTGAARVLNGVTGQLVAGFSAAGGQSFADLAALGDTDGDGVPELLASEGGTPPYSTAPVTALHVALPAGGVLHHFANQHGEDGLGAVVDALGDTDGDGAADWLVASAHRVVVFSGADHGALVDVDPDLTGLTSVFASASGGALGDVDGDGVTDIALGNGLFGGVAFSGDGRVRVLSGASGESLAVRDGPLSLAESFGGHVAATTDHDGDGIRDLYVSSSTKDFAGFVNAGEVALVSGATLETLLTLHGLPQTTGDFGQSVDASADVTGDGVPEVAIGSSEEWPGQLNGGALYILDGATHATLFRKDAAPNAALITGALTPDLDGDDVADFLSAEPFYVVSGEPDARGRVRAWSGATGLLLWERTGPWPQAQFGSSIAGVGDVNGDGYADVGATSHPQVSGTAGTLTLLSGPTGSTLDDVAVDGGTLFLGQIRSAGHFDAGGCADVLVGAPGYINDGGALVYASSQGGVHGFVDLGLAKAGSNGETPTLRGYGDLAAGGLVTITARHALPFKHCTWFIGLSQGNVPFKQGTLVPSPAGPFFAIGLFADAEGTVSLSAANPPPVFTGLSLYHQFWFSDPAALAKVSASNGMREIFK
ncbi:MAG TPA: VCBS repeat-containing protein [Planctomycetota bacterium]|nr:VCBS repeat-containing protein [Planctomycetota bacterium]